MSIMGTHHLNSLKYSAMNFGVPLCSRDSSHSSLGANVVTLHVGQRRMQIHIHENRTRTILYFSTLLDNRPKHRRSNIVVERSTKEPLVCWRATFTLGNQINRYTHQKQFCTIEYIPSIITSPDCFRNVDTALQDTYPSAKQTASSEYSLQNHLPSLM